MLPRHWMSMIFPIKNYLVVAWATLFTTATLTFVGAPMAGPWEKYGAPVVSAAGSWENIASPPSVPASGRYQTAPGNVWLQVESHPDLATTLKRARLFALTFEHTAAFETATGWYAIVIGVAEREASETILANLKAAGAIPEDSLFTTGWTYLVQVWPPDSATVEDDLDAAIARERSWTVETRKGVQNALIWTGDYNGVLDGEIGPGTRKAIRSFQHHNGFAESGYLTGEQIKLLEEQRIAAVQAAGFVIVDNYETGIRIGLPQAIFREGVRDGVYLVFEPVPGRSSAVLRLLSTPGDATGLRWFFDFLRTKMELGSDPYAVMKDGWFVISGTSGGVSTYVHASVGSGAIKGFLLIWPESEEQTFRPIAAAMFNSFEPILGFVLSPEPEQDGTMDARLDPEPSNASNAPPPQSPNTEDGELIATGTGFVVDASGRILTNAHVIDGCSAVGVAETIPARVVAADPALDLALLRAEDGSWPAVARFAIRPARLNADVTVVGYPLHGLLGGLNVTRGAVSATAGLGNDSAQFQITAAVQPGNSGGPVLDQGGAVIGVVQSKLDALEVAEIIGDIPQNVNFAIRGEFAKIFLAQHNVDFVLATSNAPLSPADLAEQAQAYTVLIRCLAQ